MTSMNFLEIRLCMFMTENIIDNNTVHGIQDLLNVPGLHKCFDFRKGAINSEKSPAH